MLPRTHRISRKDFPAHTERGFRVYSPLFNATVYPTEKEVRVSVVVSKKTAKTAVARNRIRRRIYSVIELYLKKISHGSTIVIYPKAETKDASFELLKSEVEQALKKAHII